MWLRCDHFYAAGYAHQLGYKRQDGSSTHQCCCLHCGDDEDGCENELWVPANACGVRSRVEGEVCCAFKQQLTRTEVAAAVRAKRRED